MYMMKLWKLVLLVLPACAMPTENERHCCFPDQFESNVFITSYTSRRSDGPELENLMGRMSYDSTNQLISVKFIVISPDGKMSTGRFISVGSTRKSYEIDEATGQCSVSEMGMQRKCVPANFKPTLHSTAHGTVNYRVFKQSSPGINQTVVVTEDRCAPVLEMRVDKDAYRQTIFSIRILTINYLNVTIGIKDRSVFDIPATCQK